MKKIGFLCLVVGLTAGCSTTTTGYQQPSFLMSKEGRKPALCAPLTDEHELILSTSEEMMADRRLHAALANLERLPDNIPAARLGKAKILRILGRSESYHLYDSLIGTCLEAYGQQGMGQLLVRVERYEEGLPLLRRAVYLEPTNDFMRNDLGVAYLNLFHQQEAQFEFTTAIELNNDNIPAAENLLTLLLFQKRDQAAQALVERRSLSVQQFEFSKQRAQELLERKARLEAEENKAHVVSEKKVSDGSVAAKVNNTSALLAPLVEPQKNISATSRTVSNKSTTPAQAKAWKHKPLVDRDVHSTVKS